MAGRPSSDKVILVTAEQSVGDEVMSASFIPHLINTNPKQIILECDLCLASLLARSFPQVDIHDRREGKGIDWLKELGDINFQISIGNLPVFFDSSLAIVMPADHSWSQMQSSEINGGAVMMILARA